MKNEALNVVTYLTDISIVGIFSMANRDRGQSLYSDDDTEANSDVADLSVAMNGLLENRISVYELLLLLFKCCIICLFLRF